VIKPGEGRGCFGVELDPLNVDVILRRYETALRSKVALEGTAEAFGSLASCRGSSEASE
jgi:hypothetical protein